VPGLPLVTLAGATPTATVAAAAPVGQYIFVLDIVGKGVTPQRLYTYPDKHEANDDYYGDQYFHFVYRYPTQP
jgi:hypothetical protein